MTTARTYYYCRVSTTEQTTDNQLFQIQERLGTGEIPPHRVETDVVSGSVPASEREGWNRILGKVERGDTVVVLKIDRLGRNCGDILNTIQTLGERGVAVRSLDLDGIDLTSPTGRMMLTMLGAMAEFERNLIRERTIASVERRRAEGGDLGGRPEGSKHKDSIQALKQSGLSQSQVAEATGVSLRTVKRNWN